MRWLTLVTSALYLCFVPATGTCDRLVDNFADGRDDGWTRSPRSGKPSVYEVESGEYILTSDSPLSGPTGVSSYWNESSDVDYGDGFWRTRLRAEQPGSNPILFLRVQDPDMSSVWKFYGFVASESDSRFGIIKFDSSAGGFPTALDQGDIPGFGSGQDWFLEAAAIGNQLALKAWPADQAEPRFPQLTAIDSTFSSGGFAVDVGVAPGIQLDSIRGSFDDIYFIQPVEGDFDLDRAVTASDIDALTSGIHENSQNSNLDVTADGTLDFDDHAFWVKNIAKTNSGDANLDGEFNAGDLIAVFQAGEYEDTLSRNSSWAEGDWNGDGEFNSGDLVAALQEGSYEQGPFRMPQVPEPSSGVLLLTAMIVLSRHGLQTATRSAHPSQHK